jgi:hypothetical protein
LKAKITTININVETKNIWIVFFKTSFIIKIILYSKT